MRIAVFGLGSIGKRHVRNLVEMGEEDLLAYDPGVLTIVRMEGMPLIPMAGSEQDVWNWKPEIVLICTPPLTHYTLAMKAINNGCHCFIEKPITVSVEHGTHLLERNFEKKVLAVGYQLRWTMKEFRNEATGDDDALFTCLQDMSTWPSQYQKDTLLEFSHELDMAQFVKGPVEAVMVKKFHTIWNINLRHLRGYSYVRLASDVPQSYRKAKSRNASWTFDPVANDQAYKDELKAFLAACRGQGWDDRLCTGAEAVHVVRIIQACRESALDCKVVHLA